MLLKFAFWFLVASSLFTFATAGMAMVYTYPVNWINVVLAVINLFVAFYFVRPQIKTN